MLKSVTAARALNAISSRPEVYYHVISGEDVDTFQYYAYVNLWIGIFNSVRESLNQPFM